MQRLIRLALGIGCLAAWLALDFIAITHVVSVNLYLASFVGGLLVGLVIDYLIIVLTGRV